MATPEELAADLDAMMSGDPEATRRMAARLAGAPPDAADERWRFINEVGQHKLANLDLYEDDESHKMLLEVDARIAADHPDMPYARRLDIAGNLVRKTLGDHQERDYGSSIEQMRLARTTPEKAREAARAEAEEVRANNSTDAEEAALDAERQQNIAEIALARRGHKAPTEMVRTGYR